MQAHLSLESCFRIFVFIFTRRQQFLHFSTHKRINPADLKLLRENYGRENDLPRSAAVKRINLRCPGSLQTITVQTLEGLFGVSTVIVFLHKIKKGFFLAISNAPPAAGGQEFPLTSLLFPLMFQHEGVTNIQDKAQATALLQGS